MAPLTYGADLDRTDPTFLEDLEESKVAVLAVARVVSDMGYGVHIPATWIRPESGERSRYSDGGDLFVLQRIEIKRRRFHFTSADDYPYPTAIVDVAHSWDNARPKPFLYVLCNDDLSYAGIVRGNTASRWIRAELEDRHAGRPRTFYQCPLELIRFVRLDNGSGR